MTIVLFREAPYNHDKLMCIQPGALTNSTAYQRFSSTLRFFRQGGQQVANAAAVRLNVRPAQGFRDSSRDGVTIRRDRRETGQETA